MENEKNNSDSPTKMYKIYYQIFLYTPIFAVLVLFFYAFNKDNWKQAAYLGSVAAIGLLYLFLKFVYYMLFQLPSKIKKKVLKCVYYAVIFGLVYYAYYTRLKMSIHKLTWTLDTYFKDNNPLNHQNPPLLDPNALDLSQMDNTDICIWEKQTLSWHFALDGLFRPVYWFADSCDKTSMNTGKDLSVYTNIMKNTNQKILAF